MPQLIYAQSQSLAPTGALYDDFVCLLLVSFWRSVLLEFLRSFLIFTQLIFILMILSMILSITPWEHLSLRTSWDILGMSWFPFVRAYLWSFSGHFLFLRIDKPRMIFGQAELKTEPS